MSGFGGFSDSEDEPDVYESSSEEWSSSPEPKKRRNNRRTSGRANKKARVKSEDEEEEEEEEEEPGEDDDEENEEDSDSSDSDAGNATKSKNGTTKRPYKRDKLALIPSGDFQPGSFVILKKDAQVGDPKKHPCIWRIDGKALLQKYEPFDEDGKVRHQTTSVYTGWSALDRDSYAPITVKAAFQNNHTMIVDVDWDNLKTINMDSD